MPDSAMSHRPLSLVVLAAAALVVAGACATLLGWLVDSPLLMTGGLGQIAMNPLTAVLFLLAAASLALQAREGRGWQLAAARGMATAIAILCLAFLARYVFPFDLEIDRLLFAERLGINRVAPNTALNFAAIAFSLLTLRAGSGRLKQFSQAAAILAAATAITSLLGYGYGAQRLYVIGDQIPMAFNTAALFALCSLAILAAQFETSIFAVLGSRAVGGVMARRLLPATIVIPILLGFVRLVGQRLGLYETEFGAALMVLITVALLVGAILMTASALNRADAEKRQAEAKIRLYADIVRQLPIGLNSWRLLDPDDPQSLTFVETNPAASELLGVPLAPLLGRKLPEAFPNVEPRHLEIFAAVAREGRCQEIPELVYEDDRIARKTWSVKAFPLPDMSVGLAFENISERKAAEERIKRFNEELEAHVQQRTRELAAANRDLLQKNQENETFVYSVSHDLRSPLVSLQGFSKELGAVGQALKKLTEQDNLPVEVRQHVLSLVTDDMEPALRFIQSSVMRLSNIIDALLRLSRAGRVEYEFRAVDVRSIVERVVESISSEVFERGIEVVVSDLPPCYGDATAVEQVFANLIGNALKYTDHQRQGRIEVGLLDADCGAAASEPGFTATHTYYVRDNGLGIAPAYHDKIFQAFQRVHASHAPGEGMGLAIVRRIVQRQGGRVWVESSEGQGSTFFVTLPSGPGGQAEQIIQNSRGNSYGKRTDGDLVGGRR